MATCLSSYGQNSLWNSVSFVVTVSVLSEPGSSVSIVSGYGLDDRAIEVRFPAEAKAFFL
jgi:hypothetical protein